MGFAFPEQPIELYRAENDRFCSYVSEILRNNLASQAAYEGSIPFARSKAFEAVTLSQMQEINSLSNDFDRYRAGYREGKVIVDRLQKLARKGYKPDFDIEVTDAIWLRHPAAEEKWPHKTLILYPDGYLASVDVGDRFGFEGWEQSKFEDFLRQVPLPTWSERTREMREEFKGRIIFWIIAVSLMLCVVYFAKWLRSSF